MGVFTRGAVAATCQQSDRAVDSQPYLQDIISSERLWKQFMKSALEQGAHVIAREKTSCPVVEKFIYDADRVPRRRTIHR